MVKEILKDTQEKWNKAKKTKNALGKSLVDILWDDFKIGENWKIQWNKLEEYYSPKNKESIEKLDIPEIILKNLIIISHIDWKYDKEEKIIIKKFAKKNSILDKLVKFEKEFKWKPTTIDDINIPNNLTETYKIDLFVLAEEVVTADWEITDEEYNCLEKLAEKLQIKTVISHLLANLKKLTETNKKLLEMNAQLKQASEEITSSIQYASSIQNAILPSKETINKLLPENFILFNPKDIVSWDFYRCQEKNDKIYFCVADCTGHWVPWAFMSMLWIASLNTIINKSENKDINAWRILDLLREKVKKTLGQTWKSWEQQDGMDITFCILDKKTNKLQFAWANNHLYIINTTVEWEDKLQMIKADRMPIWVYVKNDLFTNKEINLETWDQLYLSTDWYTDQFWWENNEKFMTKNLKKLLIKISDKTMEEQKNILEKNFKEWKWNNQQTDDVALMWVKI